MIPKHPSPEPFNENDPIESAAVYERVPVDAIDCLFKCPWSTELFTTSGPAYLFLPLFGHLYGKPKAISETITSEGAKPHGYGFKLDWEFRKAFNTSSQEVTDHIE